MVRSKGLGVAVASVLIGGGVLALAGFALASATPHQTALQCVESTTKAHTCSLTLATYPDSVEGVHGSSGGPHPDWVTYSNDNIDVPANTTVDVTINQYDSGGELNNRFSTSWAQTAARHRRWRQDHARHRPESVTRGRCTGFPATASTCGSRSRCRPTNTARCR